MAPRVPCSRDTSHGRPCGSEKLSALQTARHASDEVSQAHLGHFTSSNRAGMISVTKNPVNKACALRTKALQALRAGEG